MCHLGGSNSEFKLSVKLSDTLIVAVTNMTSLQSENFRTWHCQRTPQIDLYKLTGYHK